MNLLQALGLSIIEGLTEFLPISSTGHMILASSFFGVNQSEFVKSYEIIIQFGAILAVIWLYWQKILKNTKLWKPIVFAFIPTGIIGVTLYKFIKEYLLGNQTLVAWSLLIGGILIILFERYFPSKKYFSKIENLSWQRSLLVGLGQSLSMIPGVSRAAATIFSGLAVGLNRQEAVELSFMLAIPTMAAATGLDLIKTSFKFSSNELILLAVGFVGAFITALLVVKWFLKYVQTHDFTWFGVYRIILGAVFLIWK